jgi:hypothetical protein
MRRIEDYLTSDLFGAIPKPADLESPAMDLKVRIAHAMSRAMKRCSRDRYEIAARMSRILGREISKHMLDAYAAPSKDTHVPNLSFCIAFDEATDQNELLNLYASLRGCGVLVGEETLRAELGRLEVEESEIKKRRREIKAYLGGRHGRTQQQ